MNVHHAALWVSDLETTKDFYLDGLGLTEQTQFEVDGTTNYYVGSDTGAALQLKYDPDRGQEIEPAGLDHVALAVKDVNAAFERIVDETGCPVVREPTTVAEANARLAFIEDPDGYRLELVEYRD